MPKTAIVGAGAAGCFLAVCLKELAPDMDITVFEAGDKPLRKVKVSGGGRCNISNSFADAASLKDVYPRGDKLMKRLFKSFSPEQTHNWWTEHGVSLVTQTDNCLFPVTQNSQTVIDALLKRIERYGISIRYGCRVESVKRLMDEYDYVCLTTGGCRTSNSEEDSGSLYEDLQAMGHEMITPVPSLFTLSVGDESLCRLMGIVVEPAVLRIPGTKFSASGALLLTHWGISGPATLKLSSHAARYLNEHDYKTQVSINWLACNQQEAEMMLTAFINENPQKDVSTSAFPQIQSRLWQHIMSKALKRYAHGITYNSLTRRHINIIVEALTNDTYTVTSRYKYKDEFVTAGGVSLLSVNPNTLESRTVPRLFFAGEVLDIDGITGGFNFQACWTTAMTVARAIVAFNE